MLILAGMELIFFTVAGVGLCFRFVLKTAMIIEMFSLLLSSACTAPKPFLLLTPPGRRLVVHKGFGGDTAGTADHRDITDHLFHVQLIKLGEEEGRENICSDGVCLPKSSLCVLEYCCPWDG